jgi:hypothetical protein
MRNNQSRFRQMAVGLGALEATSLVGLCMAAYPVANLRCFFLNQYLNRSKGISMAKIKMTEKPMAATRRIKGAEKADYL